MAEGVSELEGDYCNRKSYMVSPTTPLDLALSDLERSNSRSPDFEALDLAKERILGSMLVLNINGKLYMGVQCHFHIYDFQNTTH